MVQMRSMFDHFWNLGTNFMNKYNNIMCPVLLSFEKFRNLNMAIGDRQWDFPIWTMHCHWELRKLRKENFSKFCIGIQTQFSLSLFVIIKKVLIWQSQCPSKREFHELFKTFPTLIYRSIFKTSGSLQINWTHYLVIFVL